jgi:tetratricopeptide (TPR) repeat protein
MMRLVAALLALLLFQPAAGMAASPCGSGKPADSGRIDEMLRALKREANPAAAGRIAGRIIDAWSKSGSATVDLLVTAASDAAESGQSEVALDLLDSAVALAPDHAEGWNRRAALHVSMDRYDKAMADISCVLALEPRHFPAWSEMAAIYQELGRKQQALDALLQVLSIYPANRQAQSSVGTLIEELADRPL